MNRMSRYTLYSALLLVLIGAMGCVASDSDAPVFVKYNVGLDGQCPSSGDSSGEYEPRGYIDTQSPSGYFLTPAIVNVAESTDYVDWTQRRAVVEGADVTLTVQPGLFDDAELAALENSGLTAFSMPFSVSIAPDGSIACAVFVIVLPELLQAMEGKMNSGDVAWIKASVVIYGTIGGGDFESMPFTYWVDVTDTGP